jgi:hypothetical protein
MEITWTLLELESVWREERFQSAIRQGLSEIDAALLPLPPFRVFTNELAEAGDIDRRRVWEHMQAVVSVGTVEIIDRKPGYYDIRVIHLAPETSALAAVCDPNQARFHFAQIDTADASMVESLERAEEPALQRPTSADRQRHRSGDRQRAATVAQQLSGRPKSQRGSSPDSTSLATIEAAGPGLDGSTSDAAGAPRSTPEAARRFSGAPPARRFSGAPPARRFSGAPLTDDDDEGVRDYSACAPARDSSTSLREVEVLIQETNSSSSSVSQGARRFSGAPPARRISGAPSIDLRRLDPPDLPWPEIRQTANLAGPILNTTAKQTQTRHLVLTAAIAAACLPDLGRQWVDEALQKTKAGARNSRVGYFRVCLAEGLEICGVCEPSAGERPVNGMRLLTILQKQLARSIAWYEAARERGRIAQQGGST